MLDVLPQLGLVGILVVVNAGFAGTEMALVSLREGQIQRLEGESRTGEILARLARDPNRFLATIQVGITLAGFLASAAAAVSLAERLVGPLSFLGGAAEAVSIVVVTMLLAYVTLVLGELAPKRVAMQRAERWGILAARPLAFVSALTRPAVWMLSWSTDVAVRLLGGDPGVDREEITEDELREMVAQQTTFTPKQRLIIDGAFEVTERTLEQVLRPRGDVFVLAAEDLGRDAMAALVASGHTRAPVGSRGNLDDVIGVVHMRDLYGLDDRPVSEVANDLSVFPESAGVLDVLHRLQQTRQQMAAVVDEHGSVAGIITVEDLVEELVGEIYDETDRDVLSVQHLGDGSLQLPGQFPIHDLPDIGIIDAPSGPYTTVAGLVLDQLGRVPDGPGDTVHIPGWRLEVSSVKRHAVTEVHATPDPVEPEEDDEPEGG